tara:strand:+ start:186 stop:647 length:462 start_codon:yes stop_codon:yes gene_type:complete
MNYFFILLVTLLTSCGNDFDTKYITQHSETKPYIKSFQTTFSWPAVTTNVYLVSSFNHPTSRLAPTTIAICALPSKTIEILQEAWNTLSEEGREQLIYHELSHCEALLTHDEAKTDSGLPNSLMFPSMLEDYIYILRRDYYINELRLKIKDRT